MSDRLTINPATGSDIPLILELIKELAVYERLTHEIVKHDYAFSQTIHRSP